VVDERSQVPLSGAASHKEHRQLIVPPVGAWRGTGAADPESDILSQLDPNTVLMMGDNPRLSRMPERPRLLDFFKHRLTDFSYRHLLESAKSALDTNQDEKIVLACLLHDISIGCLMRSDHGYWGAQMIAPYVDEEVAWAVRHHQALRYFPDESVGYEYPQAYVRFFGPEYVPPMYIQRDARAAMQHRWYMSARLITVHDIYNFGAPNTVDPDIFSDIIGRHFREPAEGLGFDGSAVAHMWRSAIWPNNAL
jgi:hypothetical protein